MRKFLFTVFCFLVCSYSYSQIINFPDANFKAKLLESDSGVGIAYGIGGSFKIDANNNGEIEVSEVLPVRSLYVKNSNISDLTGIEYFTNMFRLRCEENSLTTLDVTMLPNLEELGVYSNNLTNLNISGLAELRNLYSSNNHLSSIELSGLSNLRNLSIANNELASLDLSSTPNLYAIGCSNNQITSIDISNITELFQLYCSSNELETLNIKNGFSEYVIDFSDNDNLQYICVDDIQLIDIENQINDYGYTNCFANSLCSFVDGSDFYTIYGNVKYDEDGNGCDLADIDYPELFFSFSDGTNSGTAFADTSGNYTYSLQAGIYTFTPSLNNTTYFSITPENVTVTFPDDADSSMQDFCVSANGFYPDLEITMDGDSSGYYNTSVSYRIKYANNGTITQSGNISITYEDVMAVFVSSVPVISSQVANVLVWNFTDLKPFESREIEFIMDLSALEAEVDGGIVVNYEGSIGSDLSDATPDDNLFEYNQSFFCCLLNNDEFIFPDYFQLFPNPVNDIVNLIMKKQIDVKSVAIFNLLGQEIKKISFNNSHIKIDVSNFEAGHYFIKISTSQKEFSTRFIKK